MNNIVMNGWTRISKKEARKRFDIGESIRMVPVKFVPESPWGYHADISKKTASGEEQSFDAVVDAYTVYNCCYPETGCYPAFYIKTAA